MRAPSKGRTRLKRERRTGRWEIQPPTAGQRLELAAIGLCYRCMRPLNFCACQSRQLVTRWAS